MAFTFKAHMRFTSCRTSALDPVIYEPLDDNHTWKRWERTMKGEVTVPSGNILIDWNEATDRQKNLARMLDQLLDERPFLKVDQFDGIYSRIRRNDPQNPEPIGVLLMVVTPEPWQVEGKPSRQCSIDWLDVSEAETQQDVESAAGEMLDRLSFYEQILEINTFLFNTEEGGFTELAYEIQVPGELQNA